MLTKSVPNSPQRTQTTPLLTNPLAVARALTFGDGALFGLWDGVPPRTRLQNDCHDNDILRTKQLECRLSTLSEVPLVYSAPIWSVVNYP